MQRTTEWRCIHAVCFFSSVYMTCCRNNRHPSHFHPSPKYSSRACLAMLKPSKLNRYLRIDQLSRQGIKGRTHPPNKGNKGASSNSFLATNGKAAYPRYMTYTYCTPATRNSVLPHSVSYDSFSLQGDLTHFPKNRQTQLSRTTTGARGSSATYVVRKAGKYELTATSKAYVNSTLLSMEDWDEGARRRRLLRKYRRRAVIRDVDKKSPGFTVSMRLELGWRTDGRSFGG